jgi:hypothetical protein
MLIIRLKDEEGKTAQDLIDPDEVCNEVFKQVLQSEHVPRRTLASKCKGTSSILGFFR